ncbi:MAG TPA: class I SAM-dependent methyltransferase [Allocoleopsis sp.]
MKSSKTEKQALDTSSIDPYLAQHFFANERELLGYKQEVYESRFLDELKERAEEFDKTTIGHTSRGYAYELADIGIEQGLYLYSLVRKLKPEIAVETGVCNGFSTAFLLLAIAINQTGKLYSIDFPEVAETNYEEGTFWQGKRGAVIPQGKTPGWVIPEHLKSRWELTLGKSQEKLPELLTRLGKIDFFFHDSEHSYECMWFECNEAYQVLREGGIMLFDDIGWNQAFQNFAKQENKEVLYIGEDLGFFIK